LRGRDYAENLIEFFCSEGPVAGCDRAEHFRVELYLVEGHAILDAQIHRLSQRAHLHRRAVSRDLASGYGGS
jgi:hypothetical protein